MSPPKKTPVDLQSKTAQPHQSGSHPVAGSRAVSLKNVSKPIKVGTGQSWANLMKSDVDDYFRSHRGGAAGSNPGPGLLEKLTGGIKGLLKKLTKTA